MDITQDSAAIVDNALCGFTGAISFVAVEFAQAPDLSAPLIAHGPIGSPFSAVLTGLRPGTVYFYRAVVSMADGGSCFGAIKSFTTLQPTPNPVVTTGDATLILENSATITNNTFSDIPGTIESVGVQYNTSPEIGGAALSQGAIESPFAANLTGLQPNTLYYYRAVVSASGGTFYGEIKSFVTPAALITVSTGDAISISATSAIIINNRFTGIPGLISLVGVQYGNSPTLSGASLVSGAIESPFSVNLTSLQPATTYYYRAGVSATSGLYFGEIKSFTTPQRTYAPDVPAPAGT